MITLKNHHDELNENTTVNHKKCRGVLVDSPRHMILLYELISD